MLGDGDAGDARLRPSREHVIPSALGGPDALSTFDVCSGCNSKLGETTDGDLMRENIVAIVRQKFGIPGYSGKIPNVVMPASSVQTEASFEMRIPHDGEVVYHAPPQVTSTTEDNGNERFSVYGTREQVEAIVRGKKSKIERQGRRMLNPDGSILTSVEYSIAAAVPVETTELKARFSYNQITVWRGLIKIAFNFAHVALGDQWTFSSMAEPLRDAALGRGDDESVAALVSGIRLGIRDLLLRDESEKGDEAPDRHHAGRRERDRRIVGRGRAAHGGGAHRRDRHAARRRPRRVKPHDGDYACQRRRHQMDKRRRLHCEARARCQGCRRSVRRRGMIQLPWNTPTRGWLSTAWRCGSEAQTLRLGLALPTTVAFPTRTWTMSAIRR
jgi:hypothetical protein